MTLHWMGFVTRIELLENYVDGLPLSVASQLRETLYSTVGALLERDLSAFRVVRVQPLVARKRNHVGHSVIRALIQRQLGSSDHFVAITRVVQSFREDRIGHAIVR